MREQVESIPMGQYYELLEKVLRNGHDSDDRTGTGTRKLFGEQIRFDLTEGFPLLTGKLTPFKLIAAELLWFLSGSTNNNCLRLLNGTDRDTIWEEWSNEDGDLFDIYGKQFRRWETSGDEWGLVKIRGNVDDGLPDAIFKFPILDKSHVTNIGKMSLTSHRNVSGHEFVVLNYLGDSRYKIQFTETGFSTEMHSTNIVAGNVKDLFQPSVCGVGYTGSSKNTRTPKTDRLYKMWKSMISRCYDPKNKKFKSYGAAGVTVCKRWHCFANYLLDVAAIPGYENWLRCPKIYALDKDYFGATQYSPKTCAFLDKSMNQLISANCPVELDGKIYQTIKQCASVVGVSSVFLRQVLIGNVKKARNEKCHDVKFYEVKSGFVYRPLLFVDQIETLIDGLKSDPNSRRHMLVLYNPADSKRAALPACHSFAQFGAIDNKLSCHLYMRSSDTLLGLPFNIASYALLTEMLAHVTSMAPLELIISFGDVHIYKNHLQQVEELLLRTNRIPALPTLQLNDEFGSIDDFTSIDDFKVVGYKPLPHITAQVAI